MHDDYIVSYFVDIDNKSIQIITCNDEKTVKHRVTFSGVLTHSFNCILEYNILFDITDSKVELFLNDNSRQLEEMKNYCWPINYAKSEELADYLKQKKYRYYIINSSLGMCGWVLAKRFKIDEIEM